jgi:hypothetical protein
MIEMGIELTLENCVELAYWGSKTVEDLGPEELAEIPDEIRDSLRRRIKALARRFR